MMCPGAHFCQNDGVVMKANCMAIRGDFEIEWVIFPLNESRGTNLEQFGVNVPGKQVEI